VAKTGGWVRCCFPIYCIISELIQFDCFFIRVEMRKLFLTNFETETTKLKGWRWNFFSISSRGGAKLDYKEMV
jgi:hypothetical protein